MVSSFFVLYTLAFLQKEGAHQIKHGLSGNLVGISINLCKSIQKELFINDTS